MNEYVYKAKNLEGVCTEGICKAKNEAELILLIKKQGYFLMKYKKKVSRKITLWKEQSINSKELAIFCKQFSVALNAGIPISEVLRLLSNQEFSKKLKSKLHAVKESVEKGKELSEAMQESSLMFPKFMLNMIAIGEASGTLDQRLKELALYYEQEGKVKKKLKKALTYPMIVFVLFIIILVFLINVIIPVFVVTLKEMGGKIPSITQIILSISWVLQNNSMFIFLLCIFTTICLRWYIATIKGREILDKVKLTFPATKTLYKKFISANIANNLSILMGAGVSVLTALQLIKDKLGNTILEDKMQNCIHKIIEGETMSEAMKQLTIFEPLLISMIIIGEETGAIEEMLEKAAEIFREQFNDMIDQKLALVEPILIFLLALNVGIMIAAVVLPMLEVMDSI